MPPCPAGLQPLLQQLPWRPPWSVLKLAHLTGPCHWTQGLAAGRCCLPLLLRLRLHLALLPHVQHRLRLSCLVAAVAAAVAERAAGAELQ